MTTHTIGIKLGLFFADDVIDHTNATIVHHIDEERDQKLGFSLSHINLNYIFDPKDSRDYRYSDKLKAIPDPKFLPKSIDYRNIWGPILDQGALGSCVSNCVAYQLRAVLRKTYASYIDMSRLFIYYNGRIVGGFSLTEDSGLYLRNGFQSVATYGAIPETEWTYDITKFAIAPTQQMYDDATSNKMITYYSVPQNTNYIQKCLKDGWFVSFGIALYESFMTVAVAMTGNVPIPDVTKEQHVGNHAMTIVGYDGLRKIFICANSWSSSWGANGFCYIPERYLMNNQLVSYFWTVQTYSINSSDVSIPSPPIPTPAPAPAPTPTPTVPTANVPQWQSGMTYKEGERVQYDEIEYINLKRHTSNRWSPPTVNKNWRAV